MPGSSPLYKREVAAHICAQLGDDGAVDVGAGMGWWADLIGHGRMDAVEIFAPYIDRYGLAAKYHHVIHSDARGISPASYGWRYAIVGDVLEHMTADEGRRLVSDWTAQGCRLMVAVPFMSPQPGSEENGHEEHLQADLSADVMAARYPELRPLIVGDNYGYFVNYDTAPLVPDGLPSLHPPRDDLRCMAGHSDHLTRRVTVALRGQNVVHEYPAIPAHLAMDLTLDVYQWERYAESLVYCTGRDQSSHAIDIGQVWEGYETLLTIAILACGDREAAVLDFGAHLGWYTCIAGKLGYQVVAFEADAENAKLCASNAALNGCERVNVVWTWIDQNSPPVPAQRVRLLKSDVEGMEHHAVVACLDLFVAGLIDFALLEMSPVFVRENRSLGWDEFGEFGDYAGLAEWICAQGYDAFDVPHKSASPALKAHFERDPLSAIKECRVDVADLRAHLGSIDQTNFLFARRGASAP
jgi:hypothetical protein